MKRFGRPQGRTQLEARLARSGVIFLIPLFIGLVLFFIIPVAKSLWFSLSNVETTSAGYKATFQGIQSYIDALNSHTTYRQTLVQSIVHMLVTTPLVIVFSFFMASVLNQKFRGRTVFRVIMFLPVIFLSAALITLDSGDQLQNGMDGFGTYKDTFGGNAVSFTQVIIDYMKAAGASEKATQFVSDAVSKVYAVIELSGIQIVILLTGLQSISPTLYEAAKVEGGSSWENFWKITFPMISPLILTCVVYSIVDSFTAFENKVMGLIQTTAFTDLNLSLSSAMSWIYFIIVAVILGITSLVISRRVFYYDS